MKNARNYILTFKQQMEKADKIVLFVKKRTMSQNANVFYEDGKTEFIPFLHYSETKNDLILIFRQEQKPHRVFNLDGMRKEKKNNRIYFIREKCKTNKG